jgi:hypothetical protein
VIFTASVVHAEAEGAAEIETLGADDRALGEIDAMLAVGAARATTTVAKVGGGRARSLRRQATTTGPTRAKRQT